MKLLPTFQSCSLWDIEAAEKDLVLKCSSLSSKFYINWRFESFSFTTYFILLSNGPDHFIRGSERDNTFILLKIKYHTSDGYVDQRERSMRNKQNILTQMKIYNASYQNFACTKEDIVGKETSSPKCFTYNMQKKTYPRFS